MSGTCPQSPDGGAASAVIFLGDVPEEAVRWLWPGHLALGKVSILDGDPSLGKSLLSIDLVARVLRGEPMPDGTPAPPPDEALLRVATLREVPYLDPTTGETRYRPLVLPHDTAWVALAPRGVRAHDQDLVGVGDDRVTRRSPDVLTSP